MERTYRTIEINFINTIFQSDKDLQLFIYLNENELIFEKNIKQLRDELIITLPDWLYFINVDLPSKIKFKLVFDSKDQIKCKFHESIESDKFYDIFSNNLIEIEYKVNKEIVLEFIKTKYDKVLYLNNNLEILND